MQTSKKVPPELLERLRADREAIAAELPEAAERAERLREAAAENTVSGRLRWAVHQSRRPLDSIAHDAGIGVELLCDWLAADRNLRSDVLDRVAQAVGRGNVDHAPGVLTPTLATTRGDAKITGEASMTTATPDIGPVPDTWKRRHLLGLEELSAEEITLILDKAEVFKQATAGGGRKLSSAGGQDLRQPVLRELDPHAEQFRPGRPAAGGRYAGLLRLHQQPLEGGDVHRHGQEHRGDGDRRGGGAAPHARARPTCWPKTSVAACSTPATAPTSTPPRACWTS